MKCIVCNIPISDERFSFLVDCRKPITCTEHSQETKKLALMDYGHKTAGTVVILPDDPEAQRRAFRVYHRSR